MSDIAERKQAHLDLCLKEASQTGRPLFAKWRLPYRALPEVDLAQVSTQTELFGKTLSQPLIIASMTGGVEHAQKINANLAIAAETTKVGLGVGSQRIALEKVEAEATFRQMRQLAPTAVLFANMGAIQLNNGRSLDDYRRVVEMIGADGLYLHLNPLQEAIQPGGDTNYGGLLDKIGDLVHEIGVPVWVKEVGHGLDVATARALVDRGVAGIDSAGVGGTSWAWVESQRAAKPELAAWFKDFGHPTDELIEAYRGLAKSVQIVASGGIRSPIEAIKARALGADFYSLAQPFLAPALASPQAVIDFIETFAQGLKIVLFGCGCVSWEQAKTLAMEKISGG